VTDEQIRKAVGDLGPARRHVNRLLLGVLPATPAVLHEIEKSIERCVERLESALVDPPASPAGDGTPEESC
jgi:hypothetical protein